MLILEMKQEIIDIRPHNKEELNKVVNLLKYHNEPIYDVLNAFSNTEWKSYRCYNEGWVESKAKATITIPDFLKKYTKLIIKL